MKRLIRKDLTNFKSTLFLRSQPGIIYRNKQTNREFSNKNITCLWVKPDESFDEDEISCVVGTWYNIHTELFWRLNNTEKSSRFIVGIWFLTVT